jgi:2-polyprenyl-3-methyl-5-hydroxy-6-metoxy-1,4-benzoquinol methylase
MAELKKNAYGFFEIIPKPSYEEVDKFYREEFYADEYKYFNNSSLDAQKKDLGFNKEHWNRELNIIKSLKGQLPESILDIGCGWCKYIEWCSGQNIDVVGLDPSPESSEYGASLGLNVYNVNFENLEDLGRKFDLVVLKNVLEHVIDPLRFLKQIVHKYMKKGSVLQIEVPNDFNAFQLAAQEVNELDQWWVAPPAHLNYFSFQSLKNLCLDVGLKHRASRSSFPMEIFLLMGQNYVSNPELGSSCHQQRKLFEENMVKTGNIEVLDKLYESLSTVELGRLVVMFLEKE